MKTSLIVILLTFYLTACGGGGSSSTIAPVPDRTPEKITISGAGDPGIFDPSLARDPVAGLLWMSYSSVDTSIYYAPNTYWAASIRLAFSDDNGVTWQDAGVAIMV